MPDASRPRRNLRRWTGITAGLLAAVAVYTGVTYARIERQARSSEVRRTDVIVVFGAAEYAGRPSPVFRARLDHALALHQQGWAPMIIVTGGGAGDPHYTEGGVGRDYLVRSGVDEQQVIAETQSDNTGESARRVGRIMQANGFSSCLAVSDDYHVFRIKGMMRSQGVECYAAPRPQVRQIAPRDRMRIILREVVSYTAWNLGLT